MNLYIRIVAGKYSLIKGLLSSALPENDDLISQETAYLRQNVISVPGEQWVNSTGNAWDGVPCFVVPFCLAAYIMSKDGGRVQPQCNPAPRPCPPVPSDLAPDPIIREHMPG